MTQQRSADLSANVARGAKVTLNAVIKAMPPGKYFLDFTMVRTGGPVFTDEQVPPARIVLAVVDIPPVVQDLYPPNGYQAQTLSPQLWAQAVDIDAPPNSSLQYRFEVCEQDTSGNPVNCGTSAYQQGPSWTVPAGMLFWSRTYLWRAFVKDATTETPSPRSALLTQVPQPAVTSQVAGAPGASQGREFDPQIGNFSTGAIDASVTTVGPELTVARTYNSLDPRRDLAFGAGWSTRYDMRLVPDDDGSGNVVATYPDGQEVRFGKNPDGTYAAPSGRIEGLTLNGSVWTLADASGARYQFVGADTLKLTKIIDNSGHSVALTYDLTSGNLSRATVSNSQTNTDGRSLHFTWAGDHVATVSTDPVDGTPLTWTYSYTGDRLESVCAPGSVCTAYTYAPGSHYRTAVLDDRPESYWRLDESGGTSAGSAIAVNLGTDHGTYTNTGMHPEVFGVPGALAGTDDTAVSFDNANQQYVDLPAGTLKRSRDVSVELWFRPDITGSGGPLLGYQDKAIGDTVNVGVPVLYQGSDGRLHGQFYNGSTAPIVSTTIINDNRWHHVVLTQSGSIQTMYVDGVSVGTTTNPPTVDTSALTFNQVGAAFATTPGSWPAWGATSQRYYHGSIDEVAVYSHPLGPAAVAAHYRYGTQAADQLVQVTLPSGKVAAQVNYDVSTDRVSEYTDRNGGTWRVGTPLVYGGDTDLRRAIEVRDPSDRPYLYEYDALTGQMVRSGTPTGLTIKDEDKAGATPTASPTPTPTPTETCSTPDPGDPQFCTTVPNDSDGPVFVGHALDGMAIRTYTYDDRGFQSGVTDENGDTVTFGHDERGNVTSKTSCRTSPECHTEYYTYPITPSPLDPRANLPTEFRDGRSASPTDNTYLTTYAYHPTGQLATQTNPDGGSVRHTYTLGTELSVDFGTMPSGLVATSTDARGAVTRYRYYQNGDLAQITDPSGLVTRFSYDVLGRKTSETEVSDSYPTGVTTTYTYDALSRLVTVTDPLTVDTINGVTHQGRTTNTYDVDGNVVRVEVSDVSGMDASRVTSYEYDEHNRVIRVTDPEGNETSYGFDRLGNQTSMVDANGNRYEYGYTARNMIAEVRLRDWTDDPEGAPSPGSYLVLHSYAYDFAGRLVSDTDAMGREIVYAYYRDGLLESATLRSFHDPDGSTRDYVLESDSYDGAGNLIEQTNDNGSTVTQHTIDPAGRVSSVVVDPDGLNRRTSFTYDLDGNVTKTSTSGLASNVSWPMPVVTESVQFGYDLAGNLTSETESTGTTTLVTTHGYDQRGLLTSTTDPRGNVAGADPAAYTTTYTFDEVGRQTSVTGPAVSAESNGAPAQTVHPTRSVGYNTFDDQVASVDELGNTSRVVYDLLGRPTTVTAPAYIPPGSTTAIVPTTHTSYDALGNVTEMTGPRGNATRYGYDRLNRMVTRDEPASTNDERGVWHYTYTRTGEVLSVTDPTGARVESTYDDLSRQVTLTQVERRPVADNFTTRYEYDDAGNIVTVTSPTGASATKTYDKLRQLISTTDPNGVTAQFGYDFDGRTVRSVDGLGRTSRSDYDAAGRVLSEMDLDPAGTLLRQQTYDYDVAGNLTSATDPLGAVTTYGYDAMSQLVTQTEPVSDTSSITTSFGYDAAGNRTRYTDGRGNSTVYTVNTLGLPESVIEPATTAQPDLTDRTWTASYDAEADPVTLTAPGGVTRTRVYDAAGRLSNENGTGAESTTTNRTLTYDLSGRLLTVNAPGGADIYTYNDRGQLLTAAGPSGTASFGYDGDGNTTTRTDAAGTATYTYTNGRLATVSDGITATGQTMGYNAAGQLSSIDYGAGRVRRFGYDDIGRVSSDTLTNAAAQTVSSIVYGYDLNNHLTSKTTTGTAGAAHNAYTYDKAGRLTSWNDGTTATNYSWDASGNRTQAGAITATYDERNRILTSGDTTYVYTPRGTVQTQTSSGLPEGFSFDAFDRLIADDVHGYAYDGLDRLASRDGTAFGYAGQSGAVVSDGTADYARGPMDELLAVQQGTSQRLTLSDAHGDVVGDFDPANTSLAALDDSTGYDPFGQVTAASGTPGSVGFQGDWTDPATGQIHMGARWYDPGTGVFDSRDDLGYTSGDSILANRYGYAAGDPLDNTDPTGHWSCGFCRSIAHQVSRGAHAVAGAARGVASFVGDVGGFLWAGATKVWNGVTRVANMAWSATKSFYHTVGHLAVLAFNVTVAALSFGYEKTRSAVKRALNWGKEKAAQARQKVIEVKRAVTRKAKQATEWVAKHNPVPVIKALVKPLYSGIKHVVSAVAHAPAAVLAVTLDVVSDVTQAASQLYHQAVEAAGNVVEALSASARVVASYAKAAMPMVLGAAVGVLTTLGCTAVFGVATAGAGAAACLMAGFAVGGAVGAALNCPRGRSIAGCAGRGLVAGAVGGAVFLGTGGVGGGLSATLVASAASSGASDATEQLLTTGHVDGTEVVTSSLIGGATGGVSHFLGGCRGSFATDTGVLLADGSHKPIQDVRVGDRVMATNPLTGKTSAEPVTDLIRHQAPTLVTLTVDVDGDQGDQTATITGTDNHPFWVDDQGRPIGPDLKVAGHWSLARELRPGEWLDTPDHGHVTILATTTQTTPTTVYNLSVVGIHTYYVLAGPTPLLVHNCGLTPEPGRAPEGSTLEQYAEVNRGINQQTTPDFVTEYTSLSGIRYYGRTQGNTEIEQGSVLDDVLGDRFRRTCSEVCAVNEAQKAEGGLAVFGGSFRTLRVRPLGSPTESGVPFLPCEFSCRPLIRRINGTY